MKRLYPAARSICEKAQYVNLQVVGRIANITGVEIRDQWDVTA